MRTVAKENGMRRLVRAVVVAAMIGLSGCGRQVTGLDLPSGSAIAPVGDSLIRFETAGPLDFQNFTYIIVFNTTGNQQQPYAQGLNSDFKNWSAFFVVGGGAGFANNPQLEQVYQDPSSGTPRTFNVPIPAGTLSFQPTVPTASAANGFQITFNNCLLDLAPPTSTGTPIVSSNRLCPPYTQIATYWNVSLFTLDRTGSPVDSLGVNGPSDTSYRFQYDTASNASQNSFKPASGSTVQNASAQITGVETFVTPPTGAVSAPSPTPTPAPTTPP
jgi:hypothetical protein